jgi:hypothetical protein
LVLGESDLFVSSPLTSRYRMPISMGFIFANAIGIVLYLLLASRGWRIPEEHGLIPVTGEPFVWADALPVLAVFFIADTVWAVVLLRHKELRGSAWWLFTAAVWLLAIGLDFLHH